MFCGECGHKLPDDAMFCNNCGKKVANVSGEIEYHPEIPEEFYCSEPKSSSKGAMKWVIVLAVCLILGLGALAVVKLINKPVTDKSKADKVTEMTEDESKQDKVAEMTEETNVESSFMTMHVIERPSGLSGYQMLLPEKVLASSVVDQEGYDNGPNVLFDGNEDTSWQEGALGSGIGEEVTIRFQTEHKVKYIAFKLGNWRSAEHYWGNHRPAVMEIEVGDSVCEVFFEDERSVQWVELSEEIATSEINIEIRDVYYGDNPEWDEACIAEIEIYGIR